MSGKGAHQVKKEAESSASGTDNPYQKQFRTSTGDRAGRESAKMAEEIKTILQDLATQFGQLRTSNQNLQQQMAAQQQQLQQILAQPAAPAAAPQAAQQQAPQQARAEPAHKRPLPGQMTFFSLAAGEDFRVWLARFESVADAYDWGDLLKIKNLPTFLSEQAEKVFYSIPEAERANFRWSVPEGQAGAAVPNLPAPVPRKCCPRVHWPWSQAKVADCFLFSGAENSHSSNLAEQTAEA